MAGEIMSQDQPTICCLCGKPFDGFGNNPEPVKLYEEGRCCNACNKNLVIPWRVEYGRDAFPLDIPIGSGKHFDQCVGFQRSMGKLDKDYVLPNGDRIPDGSPVYEVSDEELKKLKGFREPDVPLDDLYTKYYPQRNPASKDAIGDAVKDAIGDAVALSLSSPVPGRDQWDFRNIRRRWDK